MPPNQPLLARASRALPSTLALLVAALVPAGAHAEPACPAGHAVKVDLAAWVKQARAVKSVEALDAALSQLGLPPTKEGGEPLCEAPQFGKIHVDDFRPRLRAGAEPAHFVQVLAAVCPDLLGGDPSWQVQRGAILLPQADGTLCRVDAPFVNKTGSSWGPQLCNPAVFGFENLTSADHVAVQVTETEEWCGGAGVDRGEESQLSFWELRGTELAKLLQWTASRSHYRSPTPPVSSFDTKLQLAKGPYPRAIQLTEATTCDDPGDDADDESIQEFKRCRAKTVHKTCTFDGKAYACKQAK